jgi:hypothetical protein
MTKIYDCSVINKYLIVGKHLLTTFIVILKFLKGRYLIILIELVDLVMTARRAYFSA